MGGGDGDKEVDNDDHCDGDDNSDDGGDDDDGDCAGIHTLMMMMMIFILSFFTQRIALGKVPKTFLWNPSVKGGGVPP